MRPSHRRGVVKAAGVFAVYFITARLGLMMHAVGGVASTVWPPTGIALAALLVLGWDVWPGIAAGALLVNVAVGVPFLGALGIAAGNTLEALAAAWLLRRWAGGRPPFRSLASVLALVGAALGSTTISATIGTLSSLATGVLTPSQLGAAWWAWWVGDMMGDLLVAPLLLTWYDDSRLSASRVRLSEAGLLAACIAILGSILFGGGEWARHHAHSYLFFPFLIWAAVRFGPRGAATATFATASLAIAGTDWGRGPFAAGGVEESLLQLQLFMALAAVTILVLSAVVAEREQAEEETRRLNAELDWRVLERTEELRRSEERFRLLVEGVEDYAIIMLDAEGKVASWNAAAQRINGYRSAEIVGLPIALFYTEEDVASGKPERLLKAAAETGRAEDEGWRVRKDGSKFWADVVITPMKDPFGRLRGFAKVTRDVSERRRAEETLQRLAAIVESSFDGVIGLSSDGLIESWNAGAEKIYGYSASEARGCPLQLLLPSEVWEALPGMLERIARGDRLGPIEAEFQDKEGDRLIVSMSISPIRGADGQVTGTALISRDITDLKRVEKLKAEIAERKRVDSLKDQFLGVVSHELRTPITVVQGALYNLWERMAGPLNTDQSRMIELAYFNAQRLTKLIENLLDLSRLESGKVKITRSKVDLGALLAESVRTFAGQARAAGLKLELEAAGDLAPVMADPDMVSQVVANLLDNAFRYARSSIVIRAELDGRDVRVSVVDDGPGITPESRGELFSKFYQINRPKGGSGYKGTGLGLAICKEIVSLHGGRIWVDSVPEKGCAFHFILPLHQDAARAASKPHEA